MRRFLVIAAVLVALGVVVARSEWGSYLCTALTQTQKMVKDQIPTDFELARLETEVNKMDRDIERLETPIAETQFEIKELKKEIKGHEQSMFRHKSELLTFASLIDANPSSNFEYKKQSFTPKGANELLTGEFNVFKKMEARLASEQQLLQVKEKHLQASLQEYHQRKAKQKEFRLELDRLKRDHQILKAEAAQSKTASDDSHGARIQKSFEALSKRLGVQRELRTLKNGPFATETKPSLPTEPEVTTDVVRSHLNQATPAPTAQNGQEKSTKTNTQKVSQ